MEDVRSLENVQKCLDLLIIEALVCKKRKMIGLFRIFRMGTGVWFKLKRLTCH